MNNKNRISQEKRQALEMIEKSKYMQTINKVSLEHGKFINNLQANDLESAEKNIARMVDLILSDSTN